MDNPRTAEFRHESPRPFRPVHPVHHLPIWLIAVLSWATGVLFCYGLVTLMR